MKRYTPVMNEKSIRDISYDVMNLYSSLKRNRLPVNKIVNEIAIELDISKMTVLQILQQSENKNG